jgi:hypothetical protein
VAADKGGGGAFAASGWGAVKCHVIIFARKGCDSSSRVDNILAGNWLWGRFVDSVFNDIKTAIAAAATRDAYTAELHVQILKYAELLEGMSGREFCAKMELNKSWGAEFAKMKKISARLRQAGLDPERI